MFSDYIASGVGSGVLAYFFRVYSGVLGVRSIILWRDKRNGCISLKGCHLVVPDIPCTQQLRVSNDCY